MSADETLTHFDAIGTDKFLAQAKAAVANQIPNIHPHNIYIVWFSKTLQNWKALLSTTIEDGLYYEVTFNGDKGVAYLDTYRKIHNREIFIADV